MLQIITRTNHKNCALVFTFCDQVNEFDKSDAEEWYNEGLNMTDLPKMTQERIFLFRGKDGQGGQMTTHSELARWVKSMLPKSEQNSRVKQF